MPLVHESWLLITIFSLGLLGFAFHRTHFLSALLCLEGMMISIYIGISLWALNLSVLSPMVLPLVVLAMTACEAGLGLSLMIATARSHGTNNLNSLNLLRC